MLKFIRKFEYYFSLMAVLTAFFLFYAFPGERLYSCFFNSDMLYLPSLYRDIFVDGINLSGWHFPPAPYFFPDTPLYFALTALFRDLRVVSCAYGALQVLLASFLFSAVFKRVFPDSGISAASLMNAIFSFMILSMFFSKQFFEIFIHMFLPTTHFGAFIVSLALFYFLLGYIQWRSVWYLIVISLLTFLTVFSDLFIFVYFVAPALGALLALRFRSSGSVSTAAPPAAVITASAFCGYAFYYLMSKADMLSVIPLPETVLTIGGRAGIVLAALAGRGAFLFVTVSFFILAVSSYFMLSAVGREENSNPLFIDKVTMWLVFSVSAGALSLFCPFASLDGESMLNIRYNFPCVFLMVFNLSLFAVYILKKNGKEFLPGSASAVFAVLVIASAAVFLMVRGAGSADFFRYKPELVSFLDDNASKYNLKCGVSDYSNARAITMFSEKGLRANQVKTTDRTFTIYYHINNINWYFQKNFIYNFVVVDRTVVLPQTIIMAFGPPAQVLKSDAGAVFFYDAPAFDRMLKDRFVRSHSLYLEKIKK